MQTSPDDPENSEHFKGQSYTQVTVCILNETDKESRINTNITVINIEEQEVYYTNDQQLNSNIQSEQNSVQVCVEITDTEHAEELVKNKCNNSTIISKNKRPLNCIRKNVIEHESEDCDNNYSQRISNEDSVLDEIVVDRCLQTGSDDREAEVKPGACSTMHNCCKNCVGCCVTYVMKISYFVVTIFLLTTRAADVIYKKERQESLSFGSCTLVLARQCPDPDVTFFLYTRNNTKEPQPIDIGNSLEESNITDSFYDSNIPTKIIIHGYNSDMTLSALVEVKHQYLLHGNYNIFTVNWGPLAPAPCYPTAVYNARHVGACTAQLVRRLLDMSPQTKPPNLHVVGFSLGAHVAAFAANHLEPDYKLPRITGLDPAMPLFTLVSRANKLDSSDAEFVDVYHTNAFVQGTVETSGHVDFYMNGGISQPGCWAEERFFACNHHRAPLYFAESITSSQGFWGWPCRNYFMYLIGLCPPKDPQILAGEYVDSTTAKGIHLIITGSIAPFAVGRFNGPLIEIIRNNTKVQQQMYRDSLILKNIKKFMNGTVKGDITETINLANNEVGHGSHSEYMNFRIHG